MKNHKVHIILLRLLLFCVLAQFYFVFADDVVIDPATINPSTANINDQAMQNLQQGQTTIQPTEQNSTEEAKTKKDTLPSDEELFKLSQEISKKDTKDKNKANKPKEKKKEKAFDEGFTVIEDPNLEFTVIQSIKNDKQEDKNAVTIKEDENIPYLFEDQKFETGLEVTHYLQFRRNNNYNSVFMPIQSSVEINKINNTRYLKHALKSHKNKDPLQKAMFSSSPIFSNTIAANRYIMHAHNDVETIYGKQSQVLHLKHNKYTNNKIMDTNLKQSKSYLKNYCSAKDIEVKEDFSSVDFEISAYCF